MSIPFIPFTRASVAFRTERDDTQIEVGVNIPVSNWMPAFNRYGYFSGTADGPRAKDVATAPDLIGLITNGTGAIANSFDAGAGFDLYVNGLQHTCVGATTWRFEYSPTLINLFVNGTLVDSQEGSFDFSDLSSRIFEYGHIDGDFQPNTELLDLTLNA